MCLASGKLLRNSDEHCGGSERKAECGAAGWKAETKTNDAERQGSGSTKSSKHVIHNILPTLVN